MNHSLVYDISKSGVTFISFCSVRKLAAFVFIIRQSRSKRSSVQKRNPMGKRLAGRGLGKMREDRMKACPV